MYIVVDDVVVEDRTDDMSDSPCNEEGDDGLYQAVVF